MALSILSTAAVASGSPRCPDDINIRWNQCYSSKIFPNGDLYEGYFVGGKPSGKGSLTMANGTKIAGQISGGDFYGIGGKFDGIVTVTNFLDGKYIGGFKDNKMNGQGTFIRNDGTVFKGKWKNNKFQDVKTPTKPIAKSVTTPITKSVTTPITKSVTTPITKSVTTPITKSVTTPITKSVTEDTSNILFIYIFIAISLIAFYIRRQRKISKADAKKRKAQADYDKYQKELERERQKEADEKVRQRKAETDEKVRKGKAEAAEKEREKLHEYSVRQQREEADEKARAKVREDAARKRKAEADKLKAEADKAAAAQVISIAKLAAAKAREEAARLRKAEADKIEVARLEKEATEHEIATKAKAKAIAEENFKLRLSNLETNLPFYPSKRTPSTELADQDKYMWDEVMGLVENEDSKKTNLYFVKLRSFMDDKEYFKIGITTQGVATRFKKSTQVELIEIISVFNTEKWKAAFLEYHFLREFRLYEGLSNSIGEQRPKVGFSGYTEVVRSNSVNKISEYFNELDVYKKLK